MQSKIPTRICKVVVTILLLSAAASLAEPPPAKVAIATYAPRPKLPWQPADVIMMHLSGQGVCVLQLRPDGSVERAQMLVSTGQPLLDKLTIDTFTKWRFVPGPKKVTIPIIYTNNLTKMGQPRAAPQR